MKARDITELAWRNLREAMLRNGLTTLGIAVGVASLVAMLSLGVGLQAMTSKRLTRSGLFDVVFVTARGGPGGFGGGQRVDNDEVRRALDETARVEMEKIPNVVEVYADLRFQAEVAYGEKRDVTSVNALPPSAGERDAFDGMQGRYFSGPEAAEAVVHVNLGKDWEMTAADLLGKELTIRYPSRKQAAPGAGKAEEDRGGMMTGFAVSREEAVVTIVGVIETDAGGFGGMGRGRVYVPMGLVRKLDPVQMTDLRDLMTRGGGSGNRTYQSVVVRVESASRVPVVQEAIRKMGFNSFSLQDASKNLARAFAILDVFLGIIGSVALAVASLGIVNTLVMAVLERRREIGILKALGASNGVIKRLFFAEAAAMGFAGGALGVFFGWVLGVIINFGMKIYMERQELTPETIMTVPWWLVAGAIGFAVGVSLVSGLYPAARAAKLDPVEALRYE